MSINKIDCKLYRKIQENILKVAESFAYNEIITDGTSCLMCETLEAVTKDLTDDIFPIRLFNRSSTNKFIMSVYGESSVRADAEIITIAIISMVASGIKEFKVTVSHIGKDDDAVEDLYNILQGYGFADYMDVNFDLKPSKQAETFAFEAVYNDHVIFKGGHGKAPMDFSFVKFNMKNLTQLLLTDKIKEIRPLPIAVVASSAPEDSYKVAFGLRAQGLNVEGYLKNTSMADAIEYTEASGITVLIWVAQDKIVMKNLKTGEMSETTMDKLLGSVKK